MKPIRIFQHQDWVGAGRITETLTERGVAYEMIAIDRGSRIPSSLDDIAGLVFLGGTMSVNDPLPWIEAELSLIRQGHDRGVPILGHCLGSQLIAKALGGEVRPMPAKEIGWHRVTRNNEPIVRQWLAGTPEQFEILIWHHDAFTLPIGAQPLYSSRFCPDQAFVTGNTLATVAHIEVTVALLREWLDIYGYDLDPLSDSVQSIDEVQRVLEARVQRMHATLTDRLYERWLERVHEREATRT